MLLRAVATSKVDCHIVMDSC